MSKEKDFDNFHHRDTLSLFGDESRSNCTVAEAKAFDREMSQARRKRTLFIGIPVAVCLVGALAVFLFFSWKNEEAAKEQARQEMENPVYSVKKRGNEDARFVIRIQGPLEELVSPMLMYVLEQAVETKPSTVLLEKQFSGEMAPKPLLFALTLNGKSEVDVANDAGETVTLDLEDPQMDAALLAKAVNAEWSAVYPNAQYPLSIELPKPKEPTAEELAEAAKEKARLEKFNNIPLADDPRMSNPNQE